MAIGTSRRALHEWYDKYVGDAENRREVYGYWTFITGYVIGVVGVLVFLVDPGTTGSAVNYQLRELSIVLAALGLTLSLMGIVLQLPVSRLGIWSAVAGTAIALFGLYYFTTVYPYNWIGQGAQNRPVIAVYTIGVGIIAGVAAAVPVLTGERSYLFSQGFESSENRDLLIGEATRGGLFAVYRKNPAEWTWRLLEQSALADGVREFASRPDVEESIEAIKETVHQAGLLEINHAAFRLYESENGWRWLLMEEDGSVVAKSGEEYPDRDTTDDAVSVLKEYGPDAERIDIDGAAFDVERDGTGWRWSLLDEDRKSLAENPVRLADRDTVDASLDDVRATAGDAGLLAIENLGIEVHHDGATGTSDLPANADEEGDSEAGDGEAAADGGGGWGWRLVDHRDEEIAVSREDFAGREPTRDAVESLREDAADAPLLRGGAPAFELVATDEGWNWRLVDGEDDVVGESHAEDVSRGAAETTVDRIRAGAADATIVEGDDPAFEVFPDGNAWRWRLVDDDRDEVAESPSEFPSRDEAEAAVEHVVSEADRAELVEFEKAAFQLYEADGGWRWRLIEEGGGVLADSNEEFESRDAAASGMKVVKENAPDAELLEIDSAAIELFSDDDGWGWRLVDEGGETIAQTTTRFDSKRGAKDAVTDVRDLFESAPTHAFAEGAFQLYEGDDGAGWFWRYLDADGEIIADGVETHTTRDNVARAVERVRDAAVVADTAAIRRVAFRVTDERGDWRWQLVDRDRQVLAESTRQYDGGDDCERAAERIRSNLADAVVFELQSPVYRVTQDEDETWTWELVDADREPIAAAPTTYEDREAAERALEPVKDLGPDAEVLEFDNAAFEVYSAEDGWGWRLVDEDYTTLAHSTATFESMSEAERALESVRTAIAEASILEIETAAFELHDREDGWVWQLVDEDGNSLAESVGTYETRTEAREAMNSLKEFGPEAGVVTAT